MSFMSVSMRWARGRPLPPSWYSKTVGCRSFEGGLHERDLQVLESPPLRQAGGAGPYEAEAAERVTWETERSVGWEGSVATMASIHTKSQVGQTLKRSTPF